MEFHRAVLSESLSHVSIDFAGMGDSGSRAVHPLISSRDIVGVLDHAGFDKATLIGHSFGAAAWRACAEFRIVRAR